MIQKLSFLNPFRPLPEGQEGLALRVSALALLVVGIECLWGAISTWFTRDAVLQQMRQSLELVSRPEVAAASRDMMGPGLVQGLIYFSIAQALLFFVLGAVQWRKPNKWIPLIVFLFFAYSLLSVPKMIYLTGFQFEGPPWGIIRTALESFLLVVIFWAGFRGGDRLDKLKKAATSPNPPASSAR